MGWPAAENPIKNSAKHKLFSEIKPVTLNQALKEESNF